MLIVAGLALIYPESLYDTIGFGLMGVVLLQKLRKGEEDLALSGSNDFSRRRGATRLSRRPAPTARSDG
jgi:hypothetical protein